MSSKNVVTIGSLIQKCLKKAYFLPQKPSSYSKGYRFLNDKKFRVFDCPPSSLDFDRCLYPFRHLPAAGNEVPIIMECQPQDYIQQHWKQWLPAFPPIVMKPLDEALRDEVPVVTTAAMQCIPNYKHSIHPDLLYKVQLKSSIVDVGVPFPKHMELNSLYYPCAVKADLSTGGRGSWLFNNASEMSALLHHVRDVCHWTDGIVCQEYISGVNEVPSFQFYLHKSGEMFWLGTTTGGFNGFSWTSGVVDWNRQEEYEHLVYEEFTLPLKKYLQSRGYFGLVTFEVLITDNGKYLVDVNPRIGGDTTHLLLARHMALDNNLNQSAIFCKNKHENMTAKSLVDLANSRNDKDKGIVVVLSVIDAINGCESYVSIFGKTTEEVKHLFHQLKVVSKIL